MTKRQLKLEQLYLTTVIVAVPMGVFAAGIKALSGEMYGVVFWLGIAAYMAWRIAGAILKEETND